MDARAPDRKKGFPSGAYFCCPSLLHETIHSGGRLVPLQTMPPQEIGNLPIPQYLQGGVGGQKRFTCCHCAACANKPARLEEGSVYKL